MSLYMHVSLHVSLHMSLYMHMSLHVSLHMSLYMSLSHCVSVSQCSHADSQILSLSVQCLSVRVCLSVLILSQCAAVSH